MKAYTDEWTNFPTLENGSILLNANHPPNEQDVYISPSLASVLKPHQVRVCTFLVFIPPMWTQISGVRFLYDNVVESPRQFESSPGLGCVLAHSMGLGKTIQVGILPKIAPEKWAFAILQVITFIDVLFRHTSARHALVVVPVNVIVNWQNEIDTWLPQYATLLSCSVRKFTVHVLDDQCSKPEQRRACIGKTRFVHNCDLHSYRRMAQVAEGPAVDWL